MIRFFAGKGGVGKTTSAASHALHLARSARTLVVSTDPAHSLGDALGVKLSAAPRRVQGKLFAAELDADRALVRWLGKRERAFRAIASRGTYLDDDDLESLFRLSLPGVDELVGLVELTRLARGFDEVVVDTAPTGHTLRLLEMPATLQQLSVVLDDLQGKHRAMAASLRGVYRRDAEDQVIDELAGQAAELKALLRDAARAEFVWVSLPEELSLAEARDGVEALRKAGIQVARLIVNRLTPAPDQRCALCDGRRAGEARVLREARSLGLPIGGVAAQDREPRGLPALRKLLPKAVLGHLTTSFKTPKARAAGPEPEWLGELAPPGVKLLFFGGKGGVGKTTAAAAAALWLARRGERVLLLSTDPAHSVGDVLDLPVGDAETPVAERLTARELDAPKAFAERRERYRAAVDELFETLRGGSRLDAPYDRAVIQDLIDLSPPGLDELFGVVAVTEALLGEAPRFDTVVVDTAPTGHALRLLELVSKAREWVQVLLQILLKYRGVVGLGQLAKDLTGTARELRLLDELLRDPARARFVAVTRAAALPRLETERLLKSLRGLHIAAPFVLVNALTPPGCTRCRRAGKAEAAEVGLLKRGRWAMLGAPALAPPPRGVHALLGFASAWTRIE